MQIGANLSLPERFTVPSRVHRSARRPDRVARPSGEPRESSSATSADTDPLWDNYRRLAIHAELASAGRSRSLFCRSKVQGFALYGRQPGQPGMPNSTSSPVPCTSPASPSSANSEEALMRERDFSNRQSLNSLPGTSLYRPARKIHSLERNAEPAVSGCSAAEISRDAGNWFLMRQMPSESKRRIVEVFAKGGNAQVKSNCSQGWQTISYFYFPAG